MQQSKPKSSHNYSSRVLLTATCRERGRGGGGTTFLVNLEWELEELVAISLPLP